MKIAGTRLFLFCILILMRVITGETTAQILQRMLLNFCVHNGHHKKNKNKKRRGSNRAAMLSECRT